MQQMLNVANMLLQEKPLCVGKSSCANISFVPYRHKERLRARSYPVTPLGPACGLIQFVNDVTPMSAVYKHWLQHTMQVRNAFSSFNCHDHLLQQEQSVHKLKSGNVSPQANVVEAEELPHEAVAGTARFVQLMRMNLNARNSQHWPHDMASLHHCCLLLTTT